MDGSRNLGERIPPDSGPQILETWIDDLHVTDSKIAFTDTRGAAPPTKLLKSVAFRVKDFFTTIGFRSQRLTLRVGNRGGSANLHSWLSGVSA